MPAYVMPAGGAVPAALALRVYPIDAAFVHDRIDGWLLDGDLIREEGQRLPFEALLANEGGTLARGVLEPGRPWPAAKAHHQSPRNTAAAARNRRSLHWMLPVCRAASA